MQKQKIFSILIIIMVIAFIVPQITLAAWWNPFSWGIWNSIFHSQTKQQKLIGGDKDSHGCLIAAGYSWCQVKNKCLRTWEEKCEVNSTIGWKTYTNTQYNFSIDYPSDTKMSNPDNVTNLVNISKDSSNSLAVGRLIGANIDYCLSLPIDPGDEWQIVGNETINGIQFSHIKNNAADSYRADSYRVVKNNACWKIYITQSREELMQNELQSILKTFKFTK